jgi:protein-S-isoprenylcysteine O-methyltransferase Ste14
LSGRIRAVFGSVLFLALAPGTVAGLVPWWISKWRFASASFLPVRALGILLILAGIAELLDSFARFALEGIGTPAPVFPTRHLVVRGLYRHVRNPMYLAVAALIFGQGLLFGNLELLAYAAAVCVGFHVFVVAYEEPTLGRNFGAEYRIYCANVPRWRPRPRPWRATIGQGPV